MNQNVGNFENNPNPILGSYSDVTGTGSSSNTLLTQNTSLFQPIPPTSAFIDGPPGHAAISICPPEWWQERQPERTPLREEEQWPNRLFSSSPPLQSVPDFAPESAPQLHQAPNQTHLLNLQDTFQLPPPMTVQHRRASDLLLPVNLKIYQATCGEEPSVQDQILDALVRLQTLPNGQPRVLAVQDEAKHGYWKCAIESCDQKPQRQWDLAAHYWKHMKGVPKPWPCPYKCGKSYTRNSDLQRHQRSSHLSHAKSDDPIPIPAADASPNSPQFLLIRTSSQPNGSQQQTLPSSASSSSTSQFNNVHVVPHFQSPMHGQFMGYQNEWAIPTHVHGSQGSYAGPYATNNTGNNEKAPFNPNKNVKPFVPIEVRRPTNTGDLDVLEKGRGGSRYSSPGQKFAHKTSSIRYTAISLAILFVVVSSMFGWQVYRTLSS